MWIRTRAIYAIGAPACLAVLLLSSCRLENKPTSLDRALQHFDSGNKLMVLDQFAKATAEYQAALKIQPDMEAAKHNLQTATRWQQWMSTLADTPGNDGVRAKVCRAYATRGRYEDARIHAGLVQSTDTKLILLDLVDDVEAKRPNAHP